VFLDLMAFLSSQYDFRANFQFPCNQMVPKINFCRFLQPY
jgi:hypothetical protein